MVKTATKHRCLRHRELDDSIYTLAHMEPTDSPVINCYLDMSRGVVEAKRYLLTRKSEIVAQLSGDEEREFNQALDRILAELEQSKPDCNSVVYFSRSFESGKFFRKLELHMPVRNSITITQAPDIIPLVLLRHEHGQYLQASVSEEAIVVNDMSLDNCILIGMATLPMDVSHQSRQATAVQLLRRIMGSNPHKEMIIDGELSFIHDLYRVLPKQMRRRVIQLLPRRPEDGDYMIHRIGKLTHKRHREYLSRERFNDAMSTGSSLDRFITGADASLHAIRNLDVSRLYLSADDLDIRMNAIRLDVNKGCLLDVVRLAIQKDIPIEFIGSSKMMFQARGISCLVNKNEALSVPGKASGETATIGLAA